MDLTQKTKLSGLSYGHFRFVPLVGNPQRDSKPQREKFAMEEDPPERHTAWFRIRGEIDFYAKWFFSSLYLFNINIFRQNCYKEGWFFILWIINTLKMLDTNTAHFTIFFPILLKNDDEQCSKQYNDIQLLTCNWTHMCKKMFRHMFFKNCFSLWIKVLWVNLSYDKANIPRLLTNIPR